MTKRLLIYSEYHLCMLAGGERWILEVAPRLRDRYGWDISIFTTTLGRNRENLSKVREILGGRGIEYSVLEASTLGLAQVYVAPKNLQVLRDCQENSDAVYWLDGIPRPFSDGVLKSMVFRGRKPLIQGLHLTPFVPRARRPSHKLYNLFSRMRLVNPLEKNNYYHTINRDYYRILRSRGVKTFYVPNGVDTKSFVPSRKKFDEFTVLFIGSRWAKGSDFVPDIVRNTLGRVRNTRFVLVGGPASFPVLRSMLEKLGDNYPGSIAFKPLASHEELRELYSKSHLFLFPSRHEGFGTVVLEAQCCGLPVLAFDIPGAPRDVIVNGVTGSLVDPYDLDAMASEIVRYHALWKEDPEAYRNMSLRSRKRALTFDWDSVVARIHHNISEITYNSDGR